MTWTAHYRADKGDWELSKDGVGHPPVWAKNRVHDCDGGCNAADYPGRWPKYGDLALCMAGTLGVVWSPKELGREAGAIRYEVTYPDGNKALAWIGVNLHTGLLWSSRQPVIVGSMYDIPEPWRPQVMVSRCCGAPVDRDTSPATVNFARDLGLPPNWVLHRVKCFVCGKTGFGPERAPLAGQPRPPSAGFHHKPVKGSVRVPEGTDGKVMSELVKRVVTQPVVEEKK